MGFNVLTKPTGALCNLDCSYCYYLEKENLYPGNSSFRMNEDTLETFIRKYIHEQPGREVVFTWQGGEPTLLGLEYYEKALDLQRKYGSGKDITNSFQTNGVLLNDDWCSFFKKNNFLIGISIDGPQHLHDIHRPNKGGQGTFTKVMKGIELLKKHGVDFNTLTVVNSLNCDYPLEIYSFLKSIGSHYIQFIPIVERLADGCGPHGLQLPLPDYAGGASLASWTVPPEKYGNFLIQVFNEWAKKDEGTYFIQAFDSALANEVGVPAGVCIFNETCGYALAIEHNGDVYSCDHYVYPEYKLGNIHSGGFKKMLFTPLQQKFGADKYDALPSQCKECEVYTYCRGECPKNRFAYTATGEPGLNYLCTGYRKFFNHIKPYIKYMASELSSERPPANVMNVSFRP